VSEQKLDPFLKWAGGKRWLVEKHRQLFDISYERYIEPFLGGGSVFFAVNPEIAVLADVNPRLIETYNAIKDNWRLVFDALQTHHERHCKDHYYNERSKDYLTSADRAAQFIYLNRTCWNGLYRVNLKGIFNVPIGTKQKVVYDWDDFERTACALQNAEIKCQDFETTISQAKENDLVYLDPPYTVNHKYNGFIKYNEKIFSWKDQIRLKDCVVNAIGRGVKIVLSNADHSSIRELYEGVGKQAVLTRSSVIAGDKMRRGTVDELVVMSW